MTNKVAVLEYLCGGGIQSEAGQEDAHALDGLLQEGWGMLRALCGDLKACGFDVSTCLSTSFANRFPGHVQELRVAGITSPREDKQWLEGWCRLAKTADVTILIAPEIDGQLYKIAQTLRTAGANLDLPSQAWLAVTGDKWKSYQLLAQTGIRQPRTILLSDFLDGDDRELSHQRRWILKRRDGAGGFGTKRFKDAKSLKALAKVEISHDQWRNWIVQEFVEGCASSLCTIVHGNEIQLVGGTVQHIQWTGKDQSSAAESVAYLGGEGPITQADSTQLYRFAQRILRAIANETSGSIEDTSARGWIGIDFIIPEGAASESEWIAIEINSRLTTSYLGYRQWYGHSIARAILQSGTKLPSLGPYSQWPVIRFDA